MEAAQDPTSGRTGYEPGPSDGGLLDRVEVIEAQPLEHRAAGFNQLADELLAELQRSDHEPIGHRDPA